jgi:ApbE superfamily uncharacterized protein (UPF0280 family)
MADMIWNQRGASRRRAAADAAITAIANLVRSTHVERNLSFVD